MKYINSELTEDIISCFYKVYNTLGYGFLEKVYENAMKIELEKKGFSIESQKSIQVIYTGEIVGKYFADIIVNNMIILEIKANDVLVEENEIQLINYLKATNLEVGLLLNFGKKPEIKRKIFSNKKNEKTWNFADYSQNNKTNEGSKYV
ncbi:MAG: GxxExxY protein [Candidatus Celaenobacter polaris]|nr:GxxExxY protein [Candidatus Celaenobacter polaris]